MKILAKISAVAICLCLGACAFVGCWGDQPSNKIDVTANTVSFRTLTGAVYPGDAVSGTPSVNEVTFENNTYTLTVPKGTNFVDVLFNKTFLTTNNVIGKNFEFSRQFNSTAKLDGHAYELVKGQGDADMWKKVGSTDTPVLATTIEEAAVYDYGTDGETLFYCYDSENAFEEEVTFTMNFKAHGGKTFDFKIKIKAANA